MTPVETDLVVLGGGPAGVAAAIAAAGQDLAVVLAEPSRLGEPLHLLAWRLLERTVDRHAGRGVAERAAVWSEFRAELARLAPLRAARIRLRLADAGVQVHRDRARFTSPHEVTLDSGQKIHFDRAVIATGGAAGPLGDTVSQRVVTPATLPELEALPEEVMVVGGGAAAAELVDALSRIQDVVVHWVMDAMGMLPRFERELADALGDVLLGRAVKLVHGKPVVAVEADTRRARVRLDGGSSYDAQLVVVCTGTIVDPSGLGLDALGGSAALGPLRCGADLSTEFEHIWLAGDSTGRCASASHADAMGRLAGRAAAGAKEARWDASTVPLIVRSHPQLAQVGWTPERLVGRAILIHTARGEESLFGWLRGVGQALDQKGFARVVCDSDTGEVLGASAAGPGAAAIASAIAVAMRHGATDESLGAVQGDRLGPLQGLLDAMR